MFVLHFFLTYCNCSCSFPGEIAALCASFSAAPKAALFLLSFLFTLSCSCCLSNGFELSHSMYPDWMTQQNSYCCVGVSQSGDMECVNTKLLLKQQLYDKVGAAIVEVWYLTSVTVIDFHALAERNDAKRAAVKGKWACGNDIPWQCTNHTWRTGLISGSGGNFDKFIDKQLICPFPWCTLL